MSSSGIIFIIDTQMHSGSEFSKMAKKMYFFKVWPIFARGGDYGPKYELFDDFGKRSEIYALTKKDIESLLHQPDPALTVQELPTNPKISFRKGSHLNFDEEQENSTKNPSEGKK